MSAEPATPPTSPVAPDMEAVKSFFHTMLARGAIAELLASIVALLVRMRDINMELMAKLAAKSRKRPPNEAMRRLQLELPLLFQAPPAAANDGPSKRERPKRGPKTPTPHGRPELPAHLPRVPDEKLVAPAQRNCPVCSGEASRIGFKTAEKLDVVPAIYVVREVKRETVACQDCHGYAHTTPKDDEVLDRGILGDELLIQAIVDHYDDAVPYERMERNARAQGVPLSANTLASTAGRVLDLFDPVVEHIAAKCLAEDYTALDATRMPVVDGKHPLGIRSGALWLIEGGHRYAYFVYAPDGRAKHIDEVLDGHALGSVMCDASATNNGVERAGGLRGGCHAHGRRGLVAALRGGDARALVGIEIYAAIFAVDATSKELGETPGERLVRRNRDAAPRVEELRLWIEASRATVEPKSILGKALGYLRNQWARLTVFLRDPRMELTNNEVERDLRRWVLARKTLFFVGHERSAKRAADALTLLTTCRKMGVEPRAYLRSTLQKILAGEKSISALLPETYALGSQGSRAADGGASAATVAA